MSSSSIPDPSSEQSYTKMATADVEAIGAHCQMTFCHQLDFLPFKCESCKGKFCLDHRSETAHSCPNAGAWARARAAQQRSSYTPSPKPSVLTHESQCSEPSCKTLINTALVPGVECDSCNRSYCLKHRLRESHDCAKLTPIGARANKEKGLNALAKLRAWGQAKQKTMTATATSTSNPKPPTSSAKPLTAAQRVRATADLKKNAKGDAKVPLEKRIYINVEASADTTKAKHPTGQFFYSSEWSIGRVLDLAATSLQVENLNNRVDGEAEKLRVFHVEGGRLLDFGEKLGAAVKTGNTLVLLRGVGPPVPDLIVLDP
ncbi:AN1 zinc finger protein, partial [Aureobasidium melanogenum]